MWYCLIQVAEYIYKEVVTSVLKDHDIVIFRVKQSMKHCCTGGCVFII